MIVHCRMETGVGKSDIQDRVLIQNSIIAGGYYSAELSQDEPFIVAVADGVGGNKAGDVAAHIAVEGLIKTKLPVPCDESLLQNKINNINERIVALSNETATLNKMATTLSGIYFTGERFLLFHVGNCRIYAWKEPYLTQLTTDHTWNQQMRYMGWSEDEIQKSRRGSEITSCLGNGDIATANQLSVTDITDIIQSAKMILLTCDGIHDFISTESLENGLLSVSSIPELLTLCTAFVRDNNSTDDLSIVVLELN